jgi:AcrR family transcriptional regulator
MMQGNKKDRRIQRTEDLLQEALIALIIKKGYSAITVQDILDQANIGRSTFYAHYRDKEALLLSGVEEMIDAFEKDYAQRNTHQTSADVSGKELSLFFFRHVHENWSLFKSMIGRQGGDVIHRTAEKYLTKVTKKYLKFHYQNRPGAYPLDLLIRCVVSCYLASLNWWLEQKNPLSPEQINDLFWDLVGPGIHSAMGELDI